MIVVEDVDLIAEERGMHPGQNPLLFQLLNEMDGLAEDTDVVFLLTTNRADVLEPALAARPGRVDQAVALELPDADARRGCSRSTAAASTSTSRTCDAVIERTEGVTASFLKELLRRAARGRRRTTVLASSGGVVSAVLSSIGRLDELLETRNAMTRTLLGGSGS